ncbi:MAG: hypothetical protein LBH28_02080 [Oscillospiraceae bacterium]|jgi:hypothetical protein|nr:hypothetical protein [Oscillospiraceae bacterium]
MRIFREYESDGTFTSIEPVPKEYFEIGDWISFPEPPKLTNENGSV